MHVHPRDLKSNTAARLMSIAAIRARLSMLAVAYAARIGAVNMIDVRATASAVERTTWPDADGRADIHG